MGRRQESPRRERERSPVRERKKHSRSKSPTRRKSPPRDNRTKRDVSESPSPRTKRLKKAKAEREVGRYYEVEKNGRKGERDSDRGGSGRDKRRESSPTRRSASRGRRDELRSPRDDDQENGENDSVAKMKAAEDTLEAKEKEKPSFELSGKLAAETNRFRGVTLLFNEPPDARKPDIRWRLYVFKSGEPLNEPLYVHRQSCYLFGRERRVADIPTDHPSCSKQHAVLQYRQVEQDNPDGTTSQRVRPYLMDLGSTNGTFINDDRMEAQRYYELFEKDNIKFGNSSREYVLLHENSAA